MLIKPKNDMYFTGAKSGRKQKMLRNVLLEIDADELVGLDKADYDVVTDGKAGEAVPEPPPKGKKK